MIRRDKGVTPFKERKRSSMRSWYYTIEPAVAMSANYKNRERLKTSDGVVVEVRTDESGYTVVAEFEE